MCHSGYNPGNSGVKPKNPDASTSARNCAHDAIARRKVIYEDLFPETKVGATGGWGAKAKVDFAKLAKSTADDAAVPDRFTLSTAKLTGRSEHAVFSRNLFSGGWQEDILSFCRRMLITPVPPDRLLRPCILAPTAIL